MKKKISIIKDKKKKGNIIRKKIKKRKSKKIKKIDKKKIYQIAIKAILITLFLFIIFSTEIIYYNSQNNKDFIIDINQLKHRHNIKFKVKDDITLVSSYFKAKAKFSHINYLNWINNFLAINHSMIFFIDNSNYQEIISKRPKEYRKKTIWIKTDITNFYSYKNYYKEFNKTYEIDIEKNIHSVQLYLIWAEKINFLKIATSKNYFHSKCIYWVDAGCFRDNSKIGKYINNWPSTEKCYEDGRIIMNEMMQNTQILKDELKRFNNQTYKNFQRFYSVDASIFGGKKNYIFKFADLYYDVLNKFIEHKIFIGKDQNIFAYIAYFYTDIVKLVYSGYNFYLQEYLSKGYNKK